MGVLGEVRCAPIAESGRAHPEQLRQVAPEVSEVVDHLRDRLPGGGAHESERADCFRDFPDNDGEHDARNRCSRRWKSCSPVSAARGRDGAREQSRHHAEGNRLEIADGSRRQQDDCGDPPPSEATLPETDEREQAQQRCSDVQRPLQEEEGERVARRREQREDGRGPGESGRAAQVGANDVYSRQYDGRGDESGYEVQEDRVHTRDEHREHVDDSVNRPERVGRERPALEHQVPGAHRLAFEDDGRSVGVPGHRVGREEAEKDGEGDERHEGPRRDSDDPADALGRP